MAPPPGLGLISIERNKFHAGLLRALWWEDAAGIPTNADKDSVASVNLARGMLRTVGGNATRPQRLSGQQAGSLFEKACEAFLQATFLRLPHLRPGKWAVIQSPGRARGGIAAFEQYQHLVVLQDEVEDPANKELAAALGRDYIIQPDIVVVRTPEDDSALNSPETIVDAESAKYAAIRLSNNATPLLHAVVSAKWTLRSDRAQNARTEALNLLRNRKGRVPHVVVITADPLPSRIASLALGTGDIDCTYHVALPELLSAVSAAGDAAAAGLMATMVDGRRLRDISDLPLDLAT